MITDKFGNVRYKIGLHIHTTISDGRVSPEESAGIYKEAGFDAINENGGLAVLAHPAWSLNTPENDMFNHGGTHPHIGRRQMCSDALQHIL